MFSIATVIQSCLVVLKNNHFYSFGNHLENFQWLVKVEVNAKYVLKCNVDQMQSMY